MSMMAAIDLAVRLQILRDKPTHYNDYNRVMGGGAADGHQFTAAEMDTFLQEVAHRLRADTPCYTYDWTQTDANQCLNTKRAGLIERIARHTTAP